MIRSLYNNFCYIGHNLIYNYYILLFTIFPTYFKSTVIDAKKNNDLYYNRMMLISFTDDIYNKYNIDLIDIHSNIIKFLNNNNNNDKKENIENDDNISVMSDLSDLSDCSSTSSGIFD